MGQKPKMQLVEVGQPFPGQVPLQEGATLDLWQSGMTVLIQMPDCMEDEVRKFKESFKRYSYYEHLFEGVHIAFWIFDFPFGMIDVNFDAKRVWDNLLNDYLDTKEGIKNLMTFYLLDGRIVRGIKAVGLDPEAVKLFHDTMKEQIRSGYTKEHYDIVLGFVYKTHTSEQLFEMGRVFKK